MTRTLALITFAAALLAAPLTAEARHNCGSSTTTKANCTTTVTTLCEYRTVNGKRQEYIVGSQTSKSCTVDAVKDVKNTAPITGTGKPPLTSPIRPMSPIKR